MTPQPGSMCAKWGGSPAVVRSAAFLAIEAEAEPVEAALDKARAQLPPCFLPPYRAAYEQVRVLRRQLAAINLRSTAQFLADNSAYAAYWGLTKSPSC